MNSEVIAAIEASAWVMWRKWLSLLVVLIGTAFLWLIVLPSVSEIPSVRERIERNRSAGINPTALFYTDHPAMPEIEKRIEREVSFGTGSFWKISPRSNSQESGR